MIVIMFMFHGCIFCLKSFIGHRVFRGDFAGLPRLIQLGIRNAFLDKPPVGAAAAIVLIQVGVGSRRVSG